MIVVPINPNTVEIPIFQSGCLKWEFDSTYPIHLNGIIRQDEFQESIANINKAISSRKSFVICTIIFILCILGGIALFIAGGLTTVTSRKSGFSVLVGVGLGIFFLGMMILIIGCCVTQIRHSTRMHQAIANESMKYSTRSPTPCSWRLVSTRIFNRGYGNRKTTVIRRIVIEIGHSVTPGYGYTPYQNNMPPPPPPPYNGSSVSGFCPQCGMARQNSIAKFCSSCGSPFSY